MHPFRWPMVRYFLFKLFVALTIVLGLQLLHKPFTDYIVKGIFDKMDFSSDDTRYLSIILINIVVIRSIYKARYNKVINFPLISFGIALVLDIFLYRLDIIKPIGWQYVSFSSIGLLYIDFIVFGIIARISSDFGIVYLNKRKEIKLDKHTNKRDLSITIPIQDKFGFQPSVEKLIADILNKDYLYKKSAYAVGIIGGWGSGKTSFVNLIKHNIENNQEKTIVIEFNPWFSKDRGQIMTDFLSLLRTELTPFSPNIGSEIDDYIWMLSDLKMGILSNFAQLIRNRNRLSLQQQFQQVNDCIQELDRPVFIIIDDVDRLMIDEIMAVLQLIRNTANFANTIFFVPYDYDYVINTMQTAGVQNPDSYLCKIINLPYSLPTVSFDKCIDLYTDLFFEIIQIDKTDRIAEHIKEALKEIGSPLTLRDAKRLANSISSTIHNLTIEKEGIKKINLDLFDLIILENLKINNPLLFVSLYLRREEMLMDKEGYLTIKETESDAIDYIRKYSSSIVTENSAKRQFSWLLALFADSTLHFRKVSGHSRIVEKSFFDFYFKRSINADFFTLPNLQEIIDNQPISTIKEYIQSFIHKDSELVLRLLKQIKFPNKEKGFELLDNLLDILNLENFPLIGADCMKQSEDEAQRLIHIGVYKDYLNNTYDLDLMADPTGMFLAYKKTIIINLLNKNGINQSFIKDAGLNMADLLFEYLCITVNNSHSWENEIMPYMKIIETFHLSINNGTDKIETLMKTRISNDLEGFIKYLNSDMEKFREYPFNHIFGAFGNVINAQRYWKDIYPKFLEKQPPHIKSESWYIQHFDNVNQVIQKIEN